MIGKKKKNIVHLYSGWAEGYIQYYKITSEGDDEGGGEEDKWSVMTREVEKKISGEW